VSDKTGIDLELVKFRATVRGYPCETDSTGLTVYRYPHDSASSPYMHFTARGGYQGDGLSDAEIVALIAPRWTLDRLLAEPPEGWTVDLVDDMGLAYLGWGLAPPIPEDCGGGQTYIMFVTLRGSQLAEPPECLTTDLPSVIAGHKAAAKLAYILAEI
jgi:hypothetical protein